MPKPRLRDTWILRKQEAITFGILFVGMSAIWFAFGWLLTHPLKDSWIVRTDESIAEWFVDQRTPTLNSLSFIGSMLSDTLVKIVVTAIAAVVMLKVWKRWLEPLVVCMSLILEALCFITVTTLVGRPRPDVQHLDTSPVGSSYPSGHTAAAVAYSAIIVVLFWHIRTRWIRALFGRAGSDHSCVRRPGSDVPRHALPLRCRVGRAARRRLRHRHHGRATPSGRVP